MTICFKHQWKDSKGRPTAVYDMDTPNRSFVKMSRILEMMGIKNYLFPLSIYDKRLLGVRPHELDEINDPDGFIRGLVVQESKYNFWYWLREVARLPPVAGAPVSVRLDRGGLAMAWCYLNSVNYIGIQPRQTGKEQPLDCKIKTPDGWTTMGEVELGDTVTAWDGSPTQVIGIHPQGERLVYRIVFEDGRSTKCGENHLWKVRKGSSPDWETIPLKEMETRLNDGVSLTIPLCLPETEKQSKLRLNELLVANGTTTIDGVVHCTTTDKLQATEVQALVRSLGGISKQKRMISGRHGQLHFIVSIQLPQEQSFGLGVKSITRLGMEQTQCISIAHPDQLYVTDDYIVTHNSTMALLITLWIFYVAGTNVNFGMLAHQDKLRATNVSRIKEFRDLLPKYMVVTSIKNINNAEKLYYEPLRNSYLTAVATQEKAKADQILRGQSIGGMHWDEPAFCTHADITYPSLAASSSEAMDQARANGLPACFILTTTAGDPRTPHGEWAKELVLGAVNYTEKFLDLPNREALLEVLGLNSENGFINGTFSHLQLGKSNEWLLERIRGSKKNIEAIQRDWLNRWNTTVDASILNKETIKRISASRRDEPNHLEIREGFVLSWYVPDAERINYKTKPLVAGLDTSEAVGRDFTAMVAIDPSTFEVVFTFKCNEVSLTKLSAFFVNLTIEYPRMILVPERKSSGGGIADNIVSILCARGISPFTRIYSKVIQERRSPQFMAFDINDLTISDKAERKYIGFMTNASSRDILYKSVLHRAIEVGADMMYDPDLITEITTLTVKNGRIDHADNKHDDLVVAWMLACYLLLEGKNLGYYGLSEHTYMQYSSVGASKDSIDAQMDIHRKCIAMRDKINSTSDPFQKNIFTHQLRQLEGRIDPSIKIDPLTIDALKDHTKKEPKVRKAINEQIAMFAR